MRTIVLLASLGCAACEVGAPDEGSFLETRYVRYVSDQAVTPCGGLARETDKQIEYLFDLLSEPYPAPRPIEYEWVEDNSTLTCSINAAGCAYATAEGAAIASIYLADLHELAHAAHLLTIGTSHRVLTEGFASYASNQPGTARPSGHNLLHAGDRGVHHCGDVVIRPISTRGALRRHDDRTPWITAFKAFWLKVPRDAQLAEVRAAYEATFGESWSNGLAAIASREQTSFSDPYCEGDVQVVGDSLKLTFTQTCEDEEVTGPAAELRSRERAVAYSHRAHLGGHVSLPIQQRRWAHGAGRRPPGL
jgi:hypothetical protein